LKDDEMTNNSKPLYGSNRDSLCHCPLRKKIISTRFEAFTIRAFFE